MKITILDTCRRVSKGGKPYVQAAFRSTNKAGLDWLGEQLGMTIYDEED